MFLPIEVSHLEWTRNSLFSPTHTLSSDEGPVAELSFTNPFGSRATGQTAHGAWTFKREGFFHPRVSIRRAGSDVTIGILALSMGGGGVLTLAGSGEYRLAVSGWARKLWCFQKGGETVIGFERSGDNASVTIEPSGASPETISILCLLGRYMPVLADSDDAAIITTTTAAITCM